MIPKGVLRHVEIPRDRNKWKMPTSKFGHFWPKTMDLPLGKKSICGRNTNILLKASNRISVYENVPWDTFQAYQRQGPKTSPKKIKSGRYFNLKMIRKRVLWHAEIPRDINKWKMPTSKFGHFLPKTMDLPLGKKTIFGQNTNILLKVFNRISVSENLAWDTFEVPKGVLRHAGIPRDIKEWKMPTSKFGHFLPKTMDLPLGKKSICGRNKNILLKASNQISVSENVPWELF